jgi:hypothetical protein
VTGNDTAAAPLTHDDYITDLIKALETCLTSDATRVSVDKAETTTQVELEWQNRQ